MWAIGLLGSTAYEGWCLRWVCDAYAIPVTGLPSAQAAGDRLAELELLDPGPPPERPGVLAFYRSADRPDIPAELRGCGHVTLTLGGGWEIGTSYQRPYPSAVGIRQHPWLSGLHRGWTHAEYLDQARRPAVRAGDVP
jgi:hypothetical protein